MKRIYQVKKLRSLSVYKKGLVSVDEGLFIEQSGVSGLTSVYKKGLVSVVEGLFIEQSDASGLLCTV